MKKNFYFIFLFIILVNVFFISCSISDKEEFADLNTLKTEGLVGYNKTTKEIFTKETSESIDEFKSKEKLSEDFEVHSIKSLFICGTNMPTSNYEDELKEFLSKNIESTNGVFEFYIDEELIYSTQIVNGVKLNENFYGNINLKVYPCTYTGIKQCAIDGIHNQNWYQMTQCVIEGFGCVVEWYINCTIDNC